MAQTDITRMASDYADNELELFRKTVCITHNINKRGLLKMFEIKTTYYCMLSLSSDGSDRRL